MTFLKKNADISAESKLDSDLTVWESSPPGGPPATLLIALSSSEQLLANFKEFTSKAFSRHRTAQAEFVVSSFSRASKVLASWGVLFYFLVIHSIHSKMLTAFMGGMEAGIHPWLKLCSKRGECWWKVDISSSTRTKELKIQLWREIPYYFPISPGCRDCLHNWSARFNPALKGLFFFKQSYCNFSDSS